MARERVVDSVLFGDAIRRSYLSLKRRLSIVEFEVVSEENMVLKSLLWVSLRTKSEGFRSSKQKDLSLCSR